MLILPAGICPTALVFHKCGMRKIDPVDALVRVGIDGGGGSLKLIMNIFIPQTTESQKVKDMELKKLYTSLL